MIPQRSIGSNLWRGEGIPSNSLGDDGQGYQDVLNSDYYTKISGEWVKRGAIDAAAPLDYNQTTNILDIPLADTSHGGYLSFNDWNIFNGKVSTTRSINTTLPLSGGGSLSSNRTISISQSSTSTDGYLSSINWNTFNNKQSALTFGSISSTTNGVTVGNGNNSTVGPNVTVDIQTSSGLQPGLLSSTDWTTFNIKADTNSPVFTGTPLAPTASPGTNTTQLATTAFVQSQGFVTSLTTMPTASQTSTTIVTSATTTYVTAISTSITITASSSRVYANATAVLTTSAVATVAKCRVSINGVAGQEQLVTLTALTTNYTIGVQALSAALGPGTYNVLFEIARNSGAGTVSFFEGTLGAIGLQGSNSNGITQLTGDVTAGPGSGSQAATITSAAVTGAKIASATITGANIAATTITNGLIANSTINLTTKVTGTLPFANGGTGITSFANQRIPFSNGTTLAGDSMFLYNSATQQFVVGNGAGTGRISGVVLLTDINPGHIAGNFYSRTTTNACLQGQNENTLPTLSLINAGGTGGASISTGFNRGTLIARTQSLSGDTIFNINTNGYTGSAFTTGNSGGMSIVASENTVAGSQGGELVLSTTPNGSNAAVERLRIKNSGESIFAKAIATAQYTTVNKLALTPSAGWVVFDTTLNKLSYYDGSNWINI